jgi:CRP-like cAMP-binding protein
MVRHRRGLFDRAAVLENVPRNTGRPTPLLRVVRAVLDAATFVGQIVFITSEKAPVSIVAKTPMRVISWPRARLGAFLKDSPDVELALGRSLSADLTRLLESAWQSPRLPATL